MGNSCIGTHNSKFNVTENQEKVQYELIQNQTQKCVTNEERDQFINIIRDEKLIETSSNFDQCLLQLDEYEQHTIPTINNSKNPQLIQRSVSNYVIPITQQEKICLKSLQEIQTGFVQRIVNKTQNIEKKFQESNEDIILISNRIILTKLKLQKKIKTERSCSSPRLIPILKQQTRNRSYSNSPKKVRFKQTGFFSKNNNKAKIGK